MKVRIVNEGKPGFFTTITDAETGQDLGDFMISEIHIEVHDRIPTAILTCSPAFDIIAEAAIKRMCPCCGLPIDKEGKLISS
jgi:hypothetical protein